MDEILHELIWRIAHYYNLQGFIPGGAGFLPLTVWLPDFPWSWKMVERQKWMELRYSIYQPAVRNYEWFVPAILQRSEVKLEPSRFVTPWKINMLNPKDTLIEKENHLNHPPPMTLGFQKCWFSGVYHTCNFSNPLAVDCRMKKSQSWSGQWGS